MISLVISQVINNKEFFAIVISFLTIVLPFWQYLRTKKQEQKQVNFEKFHEKIIRKISNQGVIAGLDEQVAVIFDLRRFPDYYPVSERILKDLVVWWTPQLKESPQFKRLINEANSTLHYIQNNKNFLKRQWTEFHSKYL